MNRLQRFNQGRDDRRLRREWRRERRKPYIDAYDARNEAESRLYRGGFFTSGPF
jgi:hypothetical protein